MDPRFFYATATGGVGPTVKVVYKKLTSMTATNTKRYTFNNPLVALQTLLLPVVMCLRGLSSKVIWPNQLRISEASIELALYEGHLILLRLFFTSM